MVPSESRARSLNLVIAATWQQKGWFRILWFSKKASGHKPGVFAFGWNGPKSLKTNRWATFVGVLERPDPKFFENRPK